MRRIRIISIVIFVAALAFSKGYDLWSSMTTSNSAPVITMEDSSIEVSCAAGDEGILAGITASDAEDGDVTGSLMVESLTDFISLGRRNATIVAYDSEDKVTKVTREIVYTDYASPRFSTTSAFRFPIGSEDVLGDLTVTDMLDGDLTESIKVTSDDVIMLYYEGTYSVVYTVTNSAGDVARLPVNVTIYDPASGAPEIELSEYLIYIDAGDTIDPWDYVQQIAVGASVYVRGYDGVLYEEDGEGTLTSDDLVITDGVDTSTDGVYEITYEYTHTSGDEEGTYGSTGEDAATGSVSLVVVVES